MSTQRSHANVAADVATSIDLHEKRWLGHSAVEAVEVGVIAEVELLDICFDCLREPDDPAVLDQRSAPADVRVSVREVEAGRDALLVDLRHELVVRGRDGDGFLRLSVLLVEHIRDWVAGEVDRRELQIRHHDFKSAGGYRSGHDALGTQLRHRVVVQVDHERDSPWHANWVLDNVFGHIVSELHNVPNVSDGRGLHAELDGRLLAENSANELHAGDCGHVRVIQELGDQSIMCHVAAWSTRGDLPHLSSASSGVGLSELLLHREQLLEHRRFDCLSDQVREHVFAVDFVRLAVQLLFVVQDLLHLEQMRRERTIGEKLESVRRELARTRGHFALDVPAQESRLVHGSVNEAGVEDRVVRQPLVEVWHDPAQDAGLGRGTLVERAHVGVAGFLGEGESSGEGCLTESLERDGGMLLHGKLKRSLSCCF